MAWKYAKIEFQPQSTQKKILGTAPDPYWEEHSFTPARPLIYITGSAPGFSCFPEMCGHIGHWGVMSFQTITH